MRRSINASVLGKLTTLIYKANSECFWLEFVNVSCYVTSFIATSTKYIQYMYTTTDYCFCIVCETSTTRSTREPEQLKRNIELKIFNMNVSKSEMFVIENM